MLRRQTTALALPLALALGGCSASETGPPRDQQRSIVVESLPAGTAPPGLPTEGVTNATVDATVRPARLAVTAWGTPGCMPYPVSVAWLDRWTIEVSTAPGPDSGCSTEYLAVSQVVVVPVDHPADEVRTVRVDGAEVAFAFRDP
ncbi:hypothetical protein [Promicromonospora kroppenstedtii]|uniref:hypothetical protein n=1 Tax=Promicromonospora kroppenstedtii TaxID=440482 RepID=UPI0004B1336A|nr:hypothetical protein [Promicromonospora kroppenstedtii]